VQEKIGIDLVGRLLDMLAGTLKDSIMPDPHKKSCKQIMALYSALDGLVEASKSYVSLLEEVIETLEKQGTQEYSDFDRVFQVNEQADVIAREGVRALECFHRLKIKVEPYARELTRKVGALLESKVLLNAVSRELSYDAREEWLREYYGIQISYTTSGKRIVCVALSITLDKSGILKLKGFCSTHKAITKRLVKAKVSLANFIRTNYTFDDLFK
jgi:hypothetical protein